MVNELTIASLPAVEISGTPTVTFDQPVEIVTGTNPLLITVPGVVDVCIVNTDISVIVETIVIDPVVNANIVSIPEITIAELPAIEISGTPTVAIDQPIEVTTGAAPLAVTDQKQ